MQFSDYISPIKLAAVTSNLHIWCKPSKSMLTPIAQMLALTRNLMKNVIPPLTAGAIFKIVTAQSIRSSLIFLEQ